MISLSALNGFVVMPFNATGEIAAGDLRGLSNVAHRWHLPADSASNQGLGGGLGWVLESEFCEGIISRFPEESVVGGFNLMRFVTCVEIVEAIARGFEVWAADHKDVFFRNLAGTEQCARRSAATDDACPWEIFIGLDNGRQYPTLAAYVTNHRASTLGEHQWWTQPVRTPAGNTFTGVDQMRRSVMRFQTHICWYLDALFCSYFHALLQEHGLDVLTLMRVVLFALFAVAAMRIGLIVFTAGCSFVCTCCRAGADEDRESRGGQRRVRCSCIPCLDYLATVSPASTMVVVFFLICPPLFYWRIFLPCWECYDFEAAVAHEVGHVLGFGHPDPHPELNLRATCAQTNATCRSPFECVTMTPYGTYEDDSIMHSLTRNQPRTCLSADDLAGLYALYPVCDELHSSTPSCSKRASYSGWLRLASVVGAPFVVAVLATVIPLGFFRRRDRRKIQRLHNERAALAKNYARARSALAATLQSRPGSSSSIRPGSAWGALGRLGSAARPSGRSTRRVVPFEAAGSAGRESVRGGGGSGGGGGGGGGSGGGGAKRTGEASVPASSNGGARRKSSTARSGSTTGAWDERP